MMEIVIAMEIAQMTVMNLTVRSMFALKQNGYVLMVLHALQHKLIPGYSSVHPLHMSNQ